MPALPIASDVDVDLNHRPHIQPRSIAYAAGTRSKNKKELLANQAAMTALKTEADMLAPRNTWDISSVREWAYVAREAKKERACTRWPDYPHIRI